MGMRQLKLSLLIGSTTLLMIGFQNCAKYQYAQVDKLAEGSNAGLNTDDIPDGAVLPIDQTGNNGELGGGDGATDPIVANPTPDDGGSSSDPGGSGSDSPPPPPSDVVSNPPGDSDSSNPPGGSDTNPPPSDVVSNPPGDSDSNPPPSDVVSNPPGNSDSNPPGNSDSNPPPTDVVSNPPGNSDSNPPGNSDSNPPPTDVVSNPPGNSDSNPPGGEGNGPDPVADCQMENLKSSANIKDIASATNGKLIITAANIGDLTEIDDFHGKIVLCGVSLEKISNTGGNITLVDSTVGHIIAHNGGIHVKGENAGAEISDSLGFVEVDRKEVKLNSPAQASNGKGQGKKN